MDSSKGRFLIGEVESHFIYYFIQKFAKIFEKESHLNFPFTRKLPKDLEENYTEFLLSLKVSQSS